VLVGESVTVDIVLSDLAGEVVSAYDLDVIYDDSVVLATGVSFSGMLGDPLLWEVFQDADLSVAGLVDLAELSLLSDAALLALQGGDSVIVASIEFEAIASGISPLGFVFDAFNDVKGLRAQPLDLAVEGGSVSAIPEPGSFLLFLAGTAVVGFALRKASAKP